MNSPPPDAVPPATDAPAVPWAEAGRFWLRLGFISFGGPAAQIALMHDELVERRRWLSERRFLHALNFCMLLPGPEAQQLATYLGWLMHRTAGGIVAGLLFVLPSMLLLSGLAWAYLQWGQHALMQAVFEGVRPAITVIVLHAAWRLGSRTLDRPLLWAIAAAALLALSLNWLPFALIIGGAALVGGLLARFRPAALQRSVAPAQATDRHPVAVFDDHSALPPHARGSWWRSLRVIAIGLLLWLLPVAALLQGFGPAHGYTQMALFFTQAALLTFGGAYAVLPFVYQGAVVEHGWLSPAQMIDGLALGETTPGPLIMVVVFVGFLGGYQQSLLAADAPLLSGVVAAWLVTWFTFLPSFVFILAGAPLIESSRRALHFSAPLTAISAAVVGVIVHLSLFFGWHALWPGGWAGGLNEVALAIAVLAAIALFGFKRGTLEVLLAAAGLGLLRVAWLG